MTLTKTRLSRCQRQGLDLKLQKIQLTRQRSNAATLLLKLINLKRGDHLKPKFHLAHHVTIRYDTLSSPFILKKKSWCAVSRLLGSTAQHARHDKRDSHDTCSGVSPQCKLGWKCAPHFSRSCSWDSFNKHLVWYWFSSTLSTTTIFIRQ